MRSVEEIAPPEGTRRTRLNAAQRRESILAAAVEVFSAAGYRAGKVSDVAALVGVSEPVIFTELRLQGRAVRGGGRPGGQRVRAELEQLAGQPGSAAGLLAHALEPGIRTARTRTGSVPTGCSSPMRSR